MSDLDQIKNVIGDLKTDVAVVKTEVKEMKNSITTAVEKISDSMITLALVTEKLNNNLDEHKYINHKLEIIETEQEEQRDTLLNLKNSHDVCNDRRKTDEDRRANSPLAKARVKVVEWSFIFLVALAIFTIFNHLPDFFKFAADSNIGIQLP
jgi:chromosome segregation ATPase